MSKLTVPNVVAKLDAVQYVYGRKRPMLCGGQCAGHVWQAVRGTCKVVGSQQAARGRQAPHPQEVALWQDREGHSRLDEAAMAAEQEEAL